MASRLVAQSRWRSGTRFFLMPLEISGLRNTCRSHFIPLLESSPSFVPHWLERVSAFSPFRTDGLEGKHGHRSVLDSFDHIRLTRFGDIEIEVIVALQKSEYRRSWSRLKWERRRALAQVGGRRPGDCS